LSAGREPEALIDLGGERANPSRVGRRSASLEEAEEKDRIRASAIGRWLPFAVARAAIADYAKRVYDNSAEDNIFFLASGIAFNILLAAVPFFLLLVSGLGYGLNLSPAASLANVSALIDRLLPQESESTRAVVHSLLSEVIRVRGQVGVYSAIGFVWFSTRLFGSLRSVLASIFDIDRDRGIIAGKLFDVRVTIFSTLVVVTYTALSAYMAIATTHWAQVLADAGVPARTMGSLAYSAGRVAAFLAIGLMFYALYRYLPSRHIRPAKAFVSAAVAGTLFELAKAAFRAYIRHFNPGSFYTGTLAAGAIVILWVYYAALLFVLGGEVGQVYELRRIRRLQQHDAV
jgi:membrane protein